MKPTAVNGWLLDTHAMLWMLYEDKRLRKSARDRIDGELPIYYSAASFWEIALKRSNRDFDFSIEDDWDILLPRALQKAEVIRLDLDASDCRRMEDLPLHHRDPFDRILIAQALVRRIGIISKDEQLDPYPILRVW
jgi:PIN domain nuclease of toxin-antitoxin system